MQNPHVYEGAVGRGKRIRTSGPCLPKEAAKHVTRRKPCICVSCSAERARNIAGISVRFTGDAPGQIGGAA